MDIANTDLCINGSITRTWEIVSANDSERHHTAAAWCYTNSRIGEIVISQTKITLLRYAGTESRSHRWLDDEPFDSCFIDAIESEGGIKRPPELAIRKSHLLHASIITIEV